MERTVELRLPRNVVGQILDGLTVLADEWRETAVFHETGAFHDETVIRECDDAEEARQMQTTYKNIIDEIYRQLEQTKLSDK